MTELWLFLRIIQMNSYDKNSFRSEEKTSNILKSSIKMAIRYLGLNTNNDSMCLIIHFKIFTREKANGIYPENLKKL